MLLKLNRILHLMYVYSTEISNVIGVLDVIGIDVKRRQKTTTPPPTKQHMKKQTNFS